MDLTAMGDLGAEQLWVDALWNRRSRVRYDAAALDRT